MGTELRTFFLEHFLIKDGIILIGGREVVFTPSGLGETRAGFA